MVLFQPQAQEGDRDRDGGDQAVGGGGEAGGRQHQGQHLVRDQVTPGTA